MSRRAGFLDIYADMTGSCGGARIARPRIGSDLRGSVHYIEQKIIELNRGSGAWVCAITGLGCRLAAVAGGDLGG